MELASNSKKVFKVGLPIKKNRLTEALLTLKSEIISCPLNTEIALIALSFKWSQKVNLYF